MSSTATTSTSFRSWALICAITASEPMVTSVTRETIGSLVGATDSDSMLYPRADINPVTRVSAPASFCSSIAITWRITSQDTGPRHSGARSLSPSLSPTLSPTLSARALKLLVFPREKGFSTVGPGRTSAGGHHHDRCRHARPGTGGRRRRHHFRLQRRGDTAYLRRGVSLQP